ncbi:hypothetical protein DNTS_024277 [Danionella cerebrum]|uniref:Uncharacterized protein n=1 Tax=Danionella cerebrum TaxID=2873325 RepID=A0A553R3A7_9TELE|nr:hypothetical protein DNTS_024277 [Danionella translucida]
MANVLLFDKTGQNHVCQFLEVEIGSPEGSTTQVPQGQREMHKKHICPGTLALAGYTTPPMSRTQQLGDEVQSLRMFPHGWPLHEFPEALPRLQQSSLRNICAWLAVSVGLEEFPSSTVCCPMHTGEELPLWARLIR